MDISDIENDVESIEEDSLKWVEEKKKVESKEQSIQNALEKLREDVEMTSKISEYQNKVLHEREALDEQRTKFSQQIEKIKQDLSDLIAETEASRSVISELEAIGENVEESLQILEERQQLIDESTTQLQEVISRLGLAKFDLENTGSTSFIEKEIEYNVPAENTAQNALRENNNRPSTSTVKPYEVDNIVFDKDCKNGKYGGNQGSLWKRDAEQKQWIYNNILKKNNPNLNLGSPELNTFYSNMDETGCAYVALLNTVFVHFQGRKEEFEKTFGYPMYDKNGNLNYDVLFADIYTTKYSDGKTFEGLRPAEGEKLIERFLKDRGVNCDAKVTSNVSPENIDTLLYDGKQVIIHYYDGNIYPADGGKAHPITAHDMVITGVTKDGKYIVSSWGNKYYLDPKEIVTRQHEDENGKILNHKTSLSYTIINYG